jgi:hypothetical protein
MSETEIPRGAKANSAEPMAAAANEAAADGPSWLNWADLPEQTQGIIGLCFVGFLLIAGYFAFRQAPLACGMPSLVADFNRQLAEFMKKENEPWIARGDPPRYVMADTRRIRALSTITQGRKGDFLVCTMEWDQGHPELPSGQFEYELGYNDKGNLTWQFYGRPPYLPVW